MIFTILKPALLEKGAKIEWFYSENWSIISSNKLISIPIIQFAYLPNLITYAYNSEISNIIVLDPRDLNLFLDCQAQQFYDVKKAQKFLGLHSAGGL